MQREEVTFRVDLATKSSDPRSILRSAFSQLTYRTAGWTKLCEGGASLRCAGGLRLRRGVGVAEAAVADVQAAVVT